MDLIQQVKANNGGGFGDLTDTGLNCALAQLQAALPYVSQIIVSGAMLDPVNDILQKALGAMMAAGAPEYDDIGREYRAANPEETAQLDHAEALYLLGLLVGSEIGALANGGAR